MQIPERIPHNRCAETLDDNMIIIFRFFNGEIQSKCSDRRELIRNSKQSKIAPESVALLVSRPDLKLFQIYPSNGLFYYRPVRGTIDTYIRDLISSRDIALSPEDDRVKEKILGQGGFGRVVRQGDAPIATKILLNNEDIPMLFVESKIPIAIKSQCCITKPIDLVLTDNTAKVNMKLASSDFFNFLRTRGNRNMILQQIARGIYEIHRKGFCHHDLKPENILLFENNGELEAEIADWGLAKFMPYTEYTITGGTYSYLPVEVNIHRYVGSNWFEHWRGGPEADIFALGVIMFFALSNSIPAHAITDAPQNIRRYFRSGLVEAYSTLRTVYGETNDRRIESIIQGRTNTSVRLTSPYINPSIMSVIREMFGFASRPSIENILESPIFNSNFRPETITAQSILMHHIQNVSSRRDLFEYSKDILTRKSKGIREFLVSLYYWNSYKSLIEDGNDEEMLKCAYTYSALLTDNDTDRVDNVLFGKGNKINPFVALPFTFFKSLNNVNLVSYLLAVERRGYHLQDPYNIAYAISQATRSEIFEIPNYANFSRFDISDLEITSEIREIARTLVEKVRFSSYNREEWTYGSIWYADFDSEELDSEEIDPEELDPEELDS